MSEILKIIDSFRAGCDCGRRHETAIQDIRIASGLVNEVGSILKENHFPENLLLVADQNTLKASDGIIDSLSDYNIEYKIYDNIRVAEMHHVEELEDLIKGKDIAILSVGTGSVNFVYVTHDQVEAMSMADVIVLMNKGQIMQEASPEDIYNDPNNVFTAQFIGTPPMNVIDMPDGNKMGFRPEKIKFSTAPVEGCYCHKAEILTREMLGSETLYKLDCGNYTFMAKSDKPDYNMGEKVFIHVNNEHLYFFDAEGQRIRKADNEELFAQLLKNAGGMSNV